MADIACDCCSARCAAGVTAAPASGRARAGQSRGPLAREAPRPGRAVPGLILRSRGLADLQRHKLGSHRVRYELKLPWLIPERPEVDALAAGLRVTSEKLDVLRGPYADLGPKVLGISPQDRSQDVGEHVVALRPIRGHPGPHRREGGRKAVCGSPALLERARQGRARL